MSQLYFPKTRLQKLRCFVTIILLSICGLAFIYLSVFLVKDKIKRDKDVAQQIINDSITKVEVQNSHKWIVDTIYTDRGYFYTIAHNLMIPKLGIKAEDSIKPTYSIHDTINF